MTTDKDTALALQVALARTDGWSKTHCVAWVDSKDAPCGKPRKEGLLCTRHHNVAVKKFDAYVTKTKQQQATRAAKRQENLPRWREELAKVRAEIDRRDPPRIGDRAAYTGAVHPSIAKKRRAALSDSNVQRMAQLWRRHDELVSLIGESA